MTKPMLSHWADVLSSGSLCRMAHPLFAHMPQPETEIVGDIVDKPAMTQDASDIFEVMNEVAATLESAGGGPVSLAVNHAPETLLAAISLALHWLGLEWPPRFKFYVAEHLHEIRIVDEFKKWKAAAGSYGKAALLDQWQREDGSFSWIKQNNSPKSRVDRSIGVMLALHHVSCLDSIPKLVKQTAFVTNDIAKLLSSPCTVWPCKVSRSHRDITEEVVFQAQRKVRVVLVSAASAYHACGGFCTGGRHALEEALCTQSTLSFSLLRAQHLAKKSNLKDQRGNPINIPEDGVVLSPGVELLRAGTTSGYKLLPERVTLAAVVSVSMPNLNASARDSLLEWRVGHDYEHLLQLKFQAVLKAANDVKAEVLVLPDIGCGVFKNPPCWVGREFGRAFQRCNTTLKEIVVLGSNEFVENFKKSINGPCMVDSPMLRAAMVPFCDWRCVRLSAVKRVQAQKIWQSPLTWCIIVVVFGLLCRAQHLRKLSWTKHCRHLIRVLLRRAMTKLINIADRKLLEQPAMDDAWSMAQSSLEQENLILQTLADPLCFVLCPLEPAAEEWIGPGSAKHLIKPTPYASRLQQASSPSVCNSTTAVKPWLPAKPLKQALRPCACNAAAVVEQPSLSGTLIPAILGVIGALAFMMWRSQGKPDIRQLTSELMEKTYESTWTQDRKTRSKHSYEKTISGCKTPYPVPHGYHVGAYKEISNPVLRERYRKAKSMLRPGYCDFILGDVMGADVSKKLEALDSEVNECLLWHGTTTARADLIAEKGFDVDASCNGLCGPGVYLAESITKAVTKLISIFSILLPVGT